MDLKEKEFYRTNIEEYVLNLPHGKRACVSKELLEELLFEKVYVKYNNNYAKLPVWYGEFLSKIDLSVVSFEDVCWSRAYKEIYLQRESEKYGVCVIDYSFTNANIDFSLSYEYKNEGKILISYCDFSGTDLSNNVFSNRRGFLDNVDLALSKIDLKKEGMNVTIYECDLSDNDLSMKVDLSDFICFNTEISNRRNIYYNTGLQINGDFKSFIGKSQYKEYLEWFVSSLDNGFFDGCYINGKLISTLEDREKIKKEMNEVMGGKLTLKHTN